jgi:hypothetical protein
MAIQESKLNDSFPHAQFNVSNYKLYRRDNAANEGGIMLYVRNDMPQFRRSDLESFSFNNLNGRIEILAVEISINKEKWLFVSCYKQPKVHTRHLIDTVDKIISRVAPYDLNLVLFGDFNVNMLKSNEFSDFLDIQGMKNLVKDSTCFKGSPTLIDLIITNKPKRFKSTICADTGLSDFHSIVCTATKIQISKLQPSTFQYRSYKNFDSELFLHDLSSIPYHIVEIFDDIDDSYWMWNKLTLQVVNEHAPLKTKTVKSRGVPYMNGELRRSINVKKMLKRRYDQDRNNTNWEKYKCQRNLVTKLRNKSVNVYVKNKCNAKSNNYRNGKDFWNTIKPLISDKGNKNNDKIILVNDNVVLTQPTAVAEIFNDYFTKIAKNIGPDDSLSDNDDVMSCILKHEGHSSIRIIKDRMALLNIDQRFSFQKLDFSQIKLYMSNLVSKKATGWDLLPSKLLKLGSAALTPSVNQLVNESISQRSFPQVLKCAEITPIFKKGNTLEVSNYRPVSILPSMSKIFERMIVSQLSVYFENIFSEFLSGFRQKHSCETVLLRLTENIKSCLDEGKVVCVLTMDLSRAFDCIPYKLFIAKLYAYGLSLEACELLVSYYRGRTQRVKLGNVVSNWNNVFKGSAQGSIFGPLSYNIFTNDLLSLLDDDVDIYNYADDNPLLCSGYDYQETLGKLLVNVNRLMTWFDENHMKVNTEKFNFIVFGKNVTPENITLRGNIIKPSTDITILGLNLDNKLNFNKHTSILCQKVGMKINALYRMNRILNESSKMLLFNSFVECYFHYCPVIWHFCSKTDTLKIEKLQRRALRQVVQDSQSTYIELLSACNKKPLYLSRIHKMMEYVFRIKHEMSPTYLKELVQAKYVPFNLRSDSKLVLPKFNTVSYGKHRFSYSAPLYWNQLSNELKNCESVTYFKKILHGFIPVCNCGFCIKCAIFNM